MPTLTERRRLRREAPMAYRMQRQVRPSLLRAYTWRALQGAARTLPILDEVGLTCLDLPLRHLRRDLDGLTVLHVTDLHLTEGGHPAAAIVPLLAGHRWDLTVYTGDLADDEAGCRALAPLLEALRPREGAFAVLGNHDHYRYRHTTGEGPCPNDLRPLLSTLDAGRGYQRRSRALQLPARGHPHHPARARGRASGGIARHSRCGSYLPMDPPFTRLVADLPATVPFVGPEALERRTGRPFRLRLGA